MKKSDSNFLFHRERWEVLDRLAILEKKGTQ